MFPVAPNHSRLFLPEQLVLHIDEYIKQKQKDNTYEVREAQKWGLSVEEYRAQEEMLSKRNEEKNKDHNNRPIILDNQQHDEENLTVGGGPGDSFPPIGKDKYNYKERSTRGFRENRRESTH